MTYRDVVVAGYDRLGPRYREEFAGSPTRVAYVRRVLERLGPGSVVVDLGCGPGEPATRMLAADHHVLGVDLSSGQLRLAAAAARRRCWSAPTSPSSGCGRGPSPPASASTRAVTGG